MLGALIIVFREVIEAGLIVGISWRRREACPVAAAGSPPASALASQARLSSPPLPARSPKVGQEIFNACVLIAAVGMLMWHNAWMSRHGREIAAEMRQVGEAVGEGSKPLTALAVVIGLAVLREGSEVVLFLYGMSRRVPRLLRWSLAVSSEDRPLAFFAGVWTTWRGVRGTKSNPVQGEHMLFGFLTTEANDVVRAVHPKAMPVILTSPEDVETWMSAPAEEAIRLQRPLPDGERRIVARGERNDEALAAI